MHEIPSVKTYVAIWATLTILTFVTYTVAKIDMGGFNIVVAMGIAFFKMMLVILFFMNVKSESPLTKLFAGRRLLLADPPARDNFSSTTPREAGCPKARCGRHRHSCLCCLRPFLRPRFVNQIKRRLRGPAELLEIRHR